MTIDRWLDKINSIGKLYNWDDHAKIFSTIARLSGNAKSWYDCQTTTPVTWNEWEEKLRVAFPPHKNIASKLKDFVNIERNPDQDVISFYYEKLRMGKHCNLPALGKGPSSKTLEACSKSQVVWECCLKWVVNLT
jgi:hypothetical protein